MQQFELGYVALYAKGWYEVSDNIIEDLKKVLRLDDYTPFTNNDVVSILLERFQETKHRAAEMKEFYYGIHPYNTYRVNYRHSTDCFSEPKRTNEYDFQLATVYYLLSKIRFLEHGQYKEVKPKYSKELRRPKEVEISKIYEVFFKKEFA